jgi:hypothetical protein
MRDAPDFVQTASGNELKQEIAAELHDHLGSILEPAGFRTSSRSGDYRRRNREGSQIIRNYTQFKGGVEKRSAVSFLPRSTSICQRSTRLLSRSPAST